MADPVSILIVYGGVSHKRPMGMWNGEEPDGTSQYSKQIDLSNHQTQMSIDERMSEIFQEYEAKWDDTMIPMLYNTFCAQVHSYVKNYKDRLQGIAPNILQNIPLGSKEDFLFQEYKTIGFFIVWISLLRTLDIRVVYMLLQRTSIMYTQYLIVYSQAKQNESSIDFSIQDLISYILKNLLGNLNVPIESNIDNENRKRLWETIVQLYSKVTVEYE